MNEQDGKRVGSWLKGLDSLLVDMEGKKWPGGY